MKSSKMSFEIGEHGSGRVKIPAILEESEFNLLFDSGATFTSLKESRQLKQKKTVRDNVFHGASGLKRKVREVVVDSFQVERRVLKNYTVSVFPGESCQQNTLGIDFFNNSNFSFLSSSKQFLCKLIKTNLPFKFFLTDKNLIALNCDIESSRFLAVWDTGAELSVVSKELRAQHQHLFKNPIQITNGVDITSSHVDFVLWELDGLSIYNKVIQNLKVLEMDFTPLRENFPLNTQMIIGFNLIVQADWCFDLASKSFSFELI